MQGFLAVPISKYFPHYNAEYLNTRLSGYLKAFGEYYVFRLTQILYSIRKQLGIVLENESFDERFENKELETSILTEYFIVFLQVLMDHLAVFMPFFYSDSSKHKLLVPKKPGEYIDRFKSFAKIRNVFLLNEEIDKALSAHLKNNMAWFDDLNKIRNSLIHGSGWLWFEYGDKSRDPKFKNVSGYLMNKEWFPSLRDFVAESYYSFLEFLSYYERHFRSRCEKEFSEFKYTERPHWFTPDSSFYKTMDYFYGEGKKLLTADETHKGKLG
jgi:hypothetical protein